MRRRIILAGLAALAGVAAWRWSRTPPGLSDAEWQAAFTSPLAPPSAPMPTYHLGHSLVGRDMPAMLAQIAGHDHHSQLGWGASLGDHWKGEVNGFAEENAHPAHRPAREALESGTYGVVIFTEMVELRDAIRYHDSATRLADWAALARTSRPDVRLYLYETWHRLGDPAGWLNRIDNDLSALWEAEVLRPAIARAGVIHVIPGGQVMAAAVRAVEAGQVPGLTRRQDFFTDDIHLNDLGSWLIAMTHYAVIYHRSPLGLPARLNRADGTPATPPPPQASAALQKVVWHVVTGYRATGVAKG
jgi:hypothetical protein